MGHSIFHRPLRSSLNPKLVFQIAFFAMNEDYRKSAIGHIRTRAVGHASVPSNKTNPTSDNVDGSAAPAAKEMEPMPKRNLQTDGTEVTVPNGDL